MAKKMTEKKAKKILKDKEIRGRPLTPNQQGLFGLIAGGGAPTKLTGQARRIRGG